ncbi:MAG: phytanoyl-CoA dioxygenase family protein [Planctomycetota bacterium]|nr:phytanoyl-CoA dioxygenase family protein [Planctomycetota bacterium]MDA1139655.1 phytanoyl-CoA dioxygenase family protein [Planctomycetota bacterium]
MTEEEKYLFDVHGYLVIRGALSSEEVAAANAAVDHHADKIKIRPNDLAHKSRTLTGIIGRGDLAGMLEWGKPHCDPFREMIAHPGYSSHLECLLGPGFRLEGLGVITMDEGAEGFWFHEGGEPMDRSRSYLYRNGRMYCGMTNVAVQLSDVNPGDGGFACLPGSHKANYPCSDEIRLYHTHQDRFLQIAAKAGDAILFVECLMHGTLPWVARHQRRSVIIRYNSGVMASGVMGTWSPPAFYDDLTDAQKAVISMPHYRYEDKGSKLYKKYEEEDSEE